MGSWVRCKCGQLIHKNLFCDTGIALAVSEEFLDQVCEGESVCDLVSKIILESKRILKCQSYGRLAILREDKDQHQLNFFLPEL